MNLRETIRTAIERRISSRVPVFPALKIAPPVQPIAEQQTMKLTWLDATKWAAAAAVAGAVVGMLLSPEQANSAANYAGIAQAVGTAVAGAAAAFGAALLKGRKG